MYNNKFTTLLTDIHNLGLDLTERDCSIVIGNLPATTEEIEFAQYDIIFNSIESNFMLYHDSYNFDHLNNDNKTVYHDLHSMASNFDFNKHKSSKLFKEMKRTTSKRERDFINRLEDEYNLYMKDIIKELRDLKEDIALDGLESVYNYRMNVWSLIIEYQHASN